MVEGGEQAVKIDDRPDCRKQEHCGQAGGGPERRTAAAKPPECNLPAAIQHSQCSEHHGGYTEQHKVQPEQHTAVGKMRLPICRPAQRARAEVRAVNQVVHHLVIRCADGGLIPTGLRGQIECVDLRIIKRPTQDGEGDRGGQEKHRQCGGKQYG